MIDFLIDEAGSNIITKEDFMLLNIEFIDENDLDMLPKVVDRLISIKGISTAVVYGIKDGIVYIVGKSRNGTSLHSIIAQHFKSIAKVSEINGFTLAMVPLGIVSIFSQEKMLQVAEDVMVEVFFSGRGTKSFSRAFERLNEVKQLVSTHV